jgi:hypothetical protein
MRRDIGYLVIWDKPGTKAAPGRFYRAVRGLGEDVWFVQRSVYGARTIQNAKELAELARRYRFKVVVFQAAEVDV